MQTWPAPTVPVLPAETGDVRVFDSTRRALVEIGPDDAGLYVCGITPYDATHLGHANTYVAFDLLVRVERDAGWPVRYVSNVTDIDDPLLERANATGVDWQHLAAEQTDLYRVDMAALRVIPPDVYRGAVEAIPDVVDAVTEMLADGRAYRVPIDSTGTATDGDIYADLAFDPAFGTVSYLDEPTMVAVFAERGGDPNRPGKRSRLDPLLWRRERPGEPAWAGGELGPGRPGWHIECTVIARGGLGRRYGICGGGSDLLFPHHEMSTSHARMLAGSKSGPRLHMHAGMVGYQGEKMSKSKGNLVLVSELRDAGTDPMAIRLALLAHHYRDDWEWSAGDLAAATERLGRWRTTLGIETEGDDLTPPAALATVSEIRQALRTDLDAPRALAAVDAWPGGPGSALVATAVDALLGVEI